MEKWTLLAKYKYVFDIFDSKKPVRYKGKYWKIDSFYNTRSEARREVKWILKCQKEYDDYHYVFRIVKRTRRHILGDWIFRV